jgi:hypothetical protein
LILEGTIQFFQITLSDDILFCVQEQIGEEGICVSGGGRVSTVSFANYTVVLYVPLVIKSLKNKNESEGSVCKYLYFYLDLLTLTPMPVLIRLIYILFFNVIFVYISSLFLLFPRQLFGYFFHSLAPSVIPLISSAYLVFCRRLLLYQHFGTDPDPDPQHWYP